MPSCCCWLPPPPGCVVWRLWTTASWLFITFSMSSALCRYKQGLCFVSVVSDNPQHFTVNKYILIHCGTNPNYIQLIKAFTDVSVAHYIQTVVGFIECMKELDSVRMFKPVFFSLSLSFHLFLLLSPRVCQWCWSSLCSTQRCRRPGELSVWVRRALEKIHQDLHRTQ